MIVERFSELFDQIDEYIWGIIEREGVRTAVFDGEKTVYKDLVIWSDIFAGSRVRVTKIVFRDELDISMIMDEKEQPRHFVITALEGCFDLEESLVKFFLLY